MTGVRLQVTKLLTLSHSTHVHIHNNTNQPQLHNISKKCACEEKIRIELKK